MEDLKERIVTNEDRILAYLKAKGEPASPKEIAAGSGVDYGVVRSLVRQMDNKGLIKRLGHGTYRLPKEADDAGPRSEPRQLPNMLGTLLSVAPVAMALFDTSSRYIMATDAYIKGLRLESKLPLEGKHITEPFDKLTPESSEYIRAAEAGECPSLETPERFEVNGGDVVYMTYSTDNWHQPDGTRGGYYVTCFFGGSPEDAELVRELSHASMGDISIVAGSKSLDVKRVTPQWSTIQKPAPFKAEIGDSGDIRSFVERVITSLIDWRAVKMMTSSKLAHPVRAAYHLLVREVEGIVYEIEFVTTVKRISSQGGSEQQQKEPPPTKEGSS